MRLLALVLLVAAQTTTDTGPIRLIVPANVKVEHCEVRSFLVGSFGGAGGYVPPPKRGERTFPIPTNYEGVTGTSLKALMWCPGYETWTTAFDPLPDLQGRTLEPRLTARPYIRFIGVIRGWATPAQPQTVTVLYSPVWTCAFFSLVDCLINPWPVADDIVVGT